MDRPYISFVVAIGKNTRAIGKNGDLLFRIPEDLQHFKNVTMGHPMIMGRKTFDSIGRVLPGRTSIVISRHNAVLQKGVVVCHSIEQAIETAKSLDDTEVTIIGGGEIFILALPYVNRIYLTEVDDDTEGDAYFPEIDLSDYTETDRKEGEFDGLKYVIRTLDKK